MCENILFLVISILFFIVYFFVHLSLFAEIAILSILCTVNSHVCLLRQRRDVSSGRDRWSLLSADRCFCKRVYAPKFIGHEQCPERRGHALEEDDEEEDPNKWWFTDEVNLLINQTNWNPKMLDQLLARSVYCSKLTLFLLNIFFLLCSFCYGFY